MIHIAPSILNANLMELPVLLPGLEKAGCEVLHLDVMDGHFVPPLTFGPVLVESLRRVTKLFLEAHLMVERPESFLEAFVKAGCRRLTVHAEATAHLHRVIGAIHDLGIEAGVSINPGTPLSAIEEVLDEVELVLIMTVNPGWGGQSFLPRCLEKLSRLRETVRSRGLSIHLEVDGGMGPTTAHLAAAAGADLIVAGSAVFGAGDPVAAFRELTRLAREAGRSPAA